MPRKPREPPALEPMQTTKEREAFKRAQELDDLKKILEDVRVRAFLWRFMSWSSMFTEQFNPNFGVTGHNLGRAAAGKWMWTEIGEANFEALLDMQAAHRAAQLESEAEPENSRTTEDAPQE